MNRDTVIALAQECQLIGMRPHLDGIYQESLERFAALVAAHEREACAKVCDQQQELVGAEMCCVAMNCAAAIRSRT